MEFMITITKDILDRSVPANCTECPIATGISDLLGPGAAMVHPDRIYYHGKTYELLAYKQTTTKQKRLVYMYDMYTKHAPCMLKYLIGTPFMVSIPDKVIEYWCGDVTKAVQKIIDSPSIRVYEQATV